MSIELVKPRRLSAGDRIAAVSPSWGGPGAYPGRYAAGKRQFQAEFGIAVIEMPHTLAPPDWVRANPKARAEDLMAAFADGASEERERAQIRQICENLAPGSALDMVEAGGRITEADPTNTSVGIGGFPDRDGKVTLDACLMNWAGDIGAVCALEDIAHPVSVARAVMESARPGE